jgi:flagellar basal body rod protein FlgB
VISDRLISRDDVTVERTLDALALRMQVIANNVANAQTP